MASPPVKEAQPRHVRVLAAVVAALVVCGLIVVGVWFALDQTPALSPGVELGVNKQPLVAPDGFVWVQGARLAVGSPDDEVVREDWNSDESLHTVTVTRDFFMQRTEVTQRLWMKTVGASVQGYEKPFRFHACGQECPAESVTWYETVAFANLYSAQHDQPPCYQTARGDVYSWADAAVSAPVRWPAGFECRGFRLPTEAEWELAARGRDHHHGSATYAGDADLDDIAWYVDNSRAEAYGLDCTKWDWKSSEVAVCGPQVVGRKPANSHGLHDMIGNVWEWTWDWYGDYPTTPAADPAGPGRGTTKSIRGCSWYTHPSGCRAASRSDHRPDGGNGNLGLRLVRTASPSASQ